MAWCAHCEQDRPITRKLLMGGACEYCGAKNKRPHKEKCRGPVPDAYDVCQYCNTPLFAKAASEESYATMTYEELQAKLERQKPTFLQKAIKFTVSAILWISVFFVLVGWIASSIFGS